MSGAIPRTLPPSSYGSCSSLFGLSLGGSMIRPAEPGSSASDLHALAFNWIASWRSTEAGLGPCGKRAQLPTLPGAVVVDRLPADQRVAGEFARPLHRFGDGEVAGVMP